MKSFHFFFHHSVTKSKCTEKDIMSTKFKTQNKNIYAVFDDTFERFQDVHKGGFESIEVSFFD